MHTVLSTNNYMQYILFPAKYREAGSKILKGMPSVLSVCSIKVTPTIRAHVQKVIWIFVYVLLIHC